MAHPIPTNTLILLLPPSLFAPALLPLFEAHFASSYGQLESWTPLEGLGRVLVVYQSTASAQAAKLEMDGFVWEDDDDEHSIEDEPTRSHAGSSQSPSSDDVGAPLRAFYGPSLTLPLPSLHQTLLSVPALSKNFLISPPGSPPVGWEQVLEEKPNSKSHHDGEEGEGWAGELERALRFLSVGVDDDETIEDEDDDDALQTTHTIIPPLCGLERPAVTLSTPFANGTTSTSPPNGVRITAVKATIESMLGRRRSFSSNTSSPGLSRTTSRENLSLGGARGNPSGLDGGGLARGLSLGRGRIIPTARPPTDSFDARKLNIG